MTKPNAGKPKESLTRKESEDNYPGYPARLKQMRKELTSVKAAELLNQGKTLKNIAEIYAVTESDVQTLLRHYNIDPKKAGKPRSKKTNQAKGRELREQVTPDVMKRDLEAGLSTSEMAEKHDVAYSTFASLRREYGLSQGANTKKAKKTEGVRREAARHEVEMKYIPQKEMKQSEDLTKTLERRGAQKDSGDVKMSLQIKTSGRVKAQELADIIAAWVKEGLTVELRVSEGDGS